MTADAKKILAKALALSDKERLELATELIASVDGPPDGDWDALWLAELDRRVQRAREIGQGGGDWTTVRARILARLTRS
ncbi:MAG: addiction module protein [Planctomycetes bacterium]|nr:addiction module protein [Planctomycetota bacterium]